MQTYLSLGLEVAETHLTLTLTCRHDKRYIKSAATRKATEAQGLKLARQLAVIRERARADREALEVGAEKQEMAIAV